MTLTTQQKSWLITYTSKIQVSFNKFKNQRSYMAVYSNTNMEPFCTFSNDSATFVPSITIGRNIATLICVYNTSVDFVSQTNAFLS